MGYRSFVQLASEVMRQVNFPTFKATTYDCYQAVNDAYREVFQYANWSFTLDRYDIPLAASYSTGTINATNGSTAITGVGTTWSASWFNKKILIAGDPEEKEVASFGGATSLTLRFPLNSTASVLTGITYTIYQDSYPVPCGQGRDLDIINPQFMWLPVRKWDRYTFDSRTAVSRFQLAVRPLIYTDDGTDTTAASPTFRQQKFQFWPPVLSAQDLVLKYFKSFTALSNDVDQTILPSEFDEVVLKLATLRLKRRFGLVAGWEDSDAYRLLYQFREKHTVSAAYTNQPGDGIMPASDLYSLDLMLGAWPGVIR